MVKFDLTQNVVISLKKDDAFRMVDLFSHNYN